MLNNVIMRVVLNLLYRKKSVLRFAITIDIVHQGQPNGEGIALNIARYRMTVSSAIWVPITIIYGVLFFACSSIHICYHFFLPCVGIGNVFRHDFKFVSNSISLLLKDEGSKTSSEGHDQRLF